MLSELDCPSSKCLFLVGVKCTEPCPQATVCLAHVCVEAIERHADNPSAFILSAILIWGHGLIQRRNENSHALDSIKKKNSEVSFLIVEGHYLMLCVLGVSGGNYLLTAA